ncbi:MAG: GFA family protein [Pseudomonadota bacterium]
MYKGSCLCGAVRFEVAGDLTDPDGCHCTKCRKTSGHFFVSCDVPQDAVTIYGGDALRWYASSPKVNRGFCSLCGSALFFDPPHLDWIAIAMGAFDGPTGVTISKHIFTADKGDYYDIADGLPQEPYPPG